MAGLAIALVNCFARTAVRSSACAIAIPRYDVEFSVDQALSGRFRGRNPVSIRAPRAAHAPPGESCRPRHLRDKTAPCAARQAFASEPAAQPADRPDLHQLLLDEPLIDCSVVRLLAAGNGGPGNLRKWLAKVDHQDDPFLLIESIPARETRHYIKSVISNLAIYRSQLGEPAPSLSELAAGGTGRFVSLAVPQVVGSDSGS